jgi:hypothetical protein
VVSINVIAGGPLTVADLYQTAGIRVKFYQNRDLLALMDDGFVGKPKSNDPLSEDSQIWSGEMTNGDVILAVFNRHAVQKVFTVNVKDFCSFTPKTVRDIWEHKNITVRDEYTVSVPAHGCVVYRLAK